MLTQEKLTKLRAAGLTVEHMTLQGSATRSLPLYLSKVQAGQPAAADTEVENLDLTEYLVPNPAKSFLVRVKGDSMVDFGIYEDDLLIVDASQKASPGDIVITSVDGEFTVKKLAKVGGRMVLQPGNPKYPVIELAGRQVQAIGVVRGSVRSFV